MQREPEDGTGSRHPSLGDAGSVTPPDSRTERGRCRDAAAFCFVMCIEYFRAGNALFVPFPGRKSFKCPFSAEDIPVPAALFILKMTKFHPMLYLAECYSICPYSAGKARCKIRHPMAQGGTPWHQMQRDSALFPMGVRIPIHQCCIPAHSRPHLALLKYSSLHGLMQAYRERHKPTIRKRGALLEQYNPLSKHGNR